MWPCDLHLVGKDIIRFHAVYWPAFPDGVNAGRCRNKFWAHGWFLMDASKMSKSKGNVVLPRPIANNAGHATPMRYFLLREVVLWPGRKFQLRRAGHAVQQRSRERTRKSCEPHRRDDRKNFGGKIPKPGPRLPQDDALAKVASEAIGEALERFEHFEFARSLEAIWGAIAAADKYLTSEQPWAKGDSEADTQRKSDYSMDDRGIAAHRDGARASGFCRTARLKCGRCWGSLAESPQ